MNPLQPIIPDIAKTNTILPADRTPGLEKSNNENSAQIGAWAKGMISQANFYQKLEESQNKDLITLTREGSGLYLWNKQRVEANKAYSDFVKLITEGTETKARGDAEIAGLTAAIDASDSVKTKQVEKLENSEEGKDIDPSDLKQLRDSAIYKGDEKTQIISFSERIPAIFAEAETGLFFLGMDGKSWKTLVHESGPEEVELGLRSYAEIVWMKALEITDDKYLLRRYVVPALKTQMKDYRTTKLTERKEVYKASQATTQKLNLSQELIVALNNNDGGAEVLNVFNRHFEVTQGKYYNSVTDKYDKPSALIDISSQVATLIKDGYISATVGDTLLNSHPAYGTDSRQDKDSSKTWADLNPIAAGKIQAAIRTRIKEDQQEKDDDQTIAAKGLTNEFVESLDGKSPTHKQLEEFKKKYRDEMGSSYPLPERILTMETDREQESSSALAALDNYYNSGGTNLDKAMRFYTGITDADDQIRADRIMDKIRQLNSLDTESRDTFVTTHVSAMTEETVGEGFHGSPRYQNTLKNATKIYNDAYQKAIDANQGVAAATTAAEDAAFKAIYDDKNLALRVRTPFDTSAAQDLQKAKAAVSKDRSIINKQEPLPGEKSAFLEAKKFYEDGGPIPSFYRELAEEIPNVSGKQLMDHRWELSGGKVDLSEIEKATEKLPPEEKKLINNNSPSTTYRVVVKDENYFNKLRDNSKVNPDYNAIRKEGAKGFVETDKPLTEYTVEEIIGLVKDDYSSFGIYDLSGRELVDALEGISEDWDLTTPFDEEFQDKLMMGILRTRANRANNIRGIDVSWNQLVNIDETSLANWQTATGITDKWSQLNVLNQAVAMAVLDETMV